MITAAIRDLKKFKRDVDKEKRTIYKNLKDAVKVEGFSKKALLQKEIEAGAPGGVPFMPITEIWRRCRKAKGKDPEAPPLSMMGKIIRYKVKQTPKTIRFSFGFGMAAISNSWKRIARVHQDGGTVESQVQEKRYFVLGRNPKYKVVKRTQLWKLPQREIIEPFINKYKNQIFRNIQRNFDRKCRGEWIQ